MKRIKKKKMISVMLMLSMLFGVCTVATAAGDPAATKSGLRSQGAIRYQDGTESVVIDSADLYTLADRLDLFKVRTVEQLGAIGTYLSAGSEGTPLTSETGIYAVHQKPASYNETDPRSLSFETILEGIAASQTIPVDPASYGMASGTTLYKGADGKLSSSAQEGGEEIRIQAATAENLSAGTAAWVNGRLILGTGGDNKAYHDLGYQEGSDSRDGNGDDGSGGYGDVNKARVIDMNNGTGSYVVQEDMTDVFFCLSYVNNHVTPVLSSGEAIKHIINNTAPESGAPYFAWDMYYIPKLTRGTVISNLRVDRSNESMNMLITVEGSKKNGSVHGIQMSKDYVVEEDLTDVFIYTISSKNRMPEFIPINDQEYVAFKLLKNVSYTYANEAYGDGAQTCQGCLYYIPELKAGTMISNLSASSYLVY